MRRYLFDGNIENFETHTIDVAIIGSGIAGLYAAYNLNPSLSCVIFTKENTDDSASTLAQGGIAVVSESDDTFEYHFKDTIKAGAGMCDEDAVHTIVEEGPWDINKLIELGCNFDKDASGRLKVTLEGGHGRKRILHSGGDATGFEIVRALKELVDKCDNVQLLENYFVVDIVTNSGSVAGIVAYNNGWHFFKTHHVIIAAGGIGQVYRYTTNPLVASGDGIAMALRAGAKLKDMEFVQFHPTGFYSETSRNKQCFLISEAVRGEGGILINEKGERYMLGRHERAELAPRDIVARENYREIENQSWPYVLLDITEKPEDFLKERFPTIYSNCLKSGINIAKQPIPVGPVQHYMMGGIETDLWGVTNVSGLYAAGEAACTGVHGANRLASNSTLECLVFGRRCATSVNNHMDETPPAPPKATKQPSNPISIDIVKEKNHIKGIMVKHGGIVRNGISIEKGLAKLDALIERIESADFDSVSMMELYNMALVSKSILSAALARKESVGAHYRED
ncbi:MAG: L-aspartate oxidase [Eubacteriales bacterium]